MALTARYLTRMDALESGAQWNPAHHASDAATRRLVAGDFAGLFTGEANDSNGLAVIDRNAAITLPWPRAIVDSWQDLLWGDAPAITSSTPAIADWLLASGPALIQELAALTHDLAITGYGVLLAEAGQLRAIESTAWQPVIDSGDASRRVGDILAWPYASGAQQDNGAPDRLRVTRIPRQGQADSATYEYQPGTIGKLLAGPHPVKVSGLWATGDGASGIAGITPLLRELCIRYTAAARVINRHANPHISGPVDSELLTKPGAYNPAGMYLPRSDPDDGYEYLTWDGKLDSAFAAIDRLTRQLALLAGPAALDLTGPGESGAARQALLWQAQARANRVRRDIEGMLLLALPAVTGEGAGSVTIDWPPLAFESWPDRAEAAALLVTAGVLSTEEARAELGLRA